MAKLPLTATTITYLFLPSAAINALNGFLNPFYFDAVMGTAIWSRLVSIHVDKH